MSIPLDSDMGREILRLAQERCPPGKIERIPPGCSIEPSIELVTAPETRGDGMNKTERAYAKHLDWRKQQGDIREWSFEPERLRIGDVKVGVKATKRAVWYKPDFRVELENGAIEQHEIKGFWREAARVRIRACASLHRCYRFVAVQRVKGTWVYEEF